MASLRWTTPPSPTMSHLRTLQDDQGKVVALADFMASSHVPEGPPNQWLYTHVTHGIVEPDGKTIQSRFPALGLSDGKRGVSIRLAFFPERWHLVQGAKLPSLVQVAGSSTFLACRMNRSGERLVNDKPGTGHLLRLGQVV
jgi:hypothetical protein